MWHPIREIFEFILEIDGGCNHSSRSSPNYHLEWQICKYTFSQNVWQWPHFVRICLSVHSIDSHSNWFHFRNFDACTLWYWWPFTGALKLFHYVRIYYQLSAISFKTNCFNWTFIHFVFQRMTKNAIIIINNCQHFAAVTSMLPIVLFPTLGILVSRIPCYAWAIEIFRAGQCVVLSTQSINRLNVIKFDLGNRQNMHDVYERCNAHVHRRSHRRVGRAIL